MSGKINESSGNGCEQNLGVFPSGQWGQTVNLLLFSFGGSNPPAPTKNSSVIMTLEFLFYPDFVKDCKGGFEQHRPPPYVPAAKKPQWGFFRCAACVVHPRHDPAR